MNVVTVVDTFAEEVEALREMHKAARQLRRNRRVPRYGVFVEKRAGVWYLCLVDRGAK